MSMKDADTDYRYCKRTQYRRSVDADPLYSTVSWRLDIFNPWSTDISESIFDIWLAPQQFRSGELFFLVPDPDVTLTVPSYTTDAVTVTFYNSGNGSFYYRSGRGFGRTEEIKPDLAAPGVEISTVNGPYSGSSMAAALTAGACAQLIWRDAMENNYPRISGRGIQTFLSRGAREQTHGRKIPRQRRWRTTDNWTRGGRR